MVNEAKEARTDRLEMLGGHSLADATKIVALVGRLQDKSFSLSCFSMCINQFFERKNL